MDRSVDPFVALGLAPTLDRAQIKRAYFGMLQRHPPHVDPEGFRRIRDAYERLSGDGLATEWSTAQIDVTHELQVLDAALAARIEAATRDWERRVHERGALAAFEAVLQLPLDVAIDLTRTAPDT